MVKFTMTSTTGLLGFEYEAGEDKNERVEFLEILRMIFLNDFEDETEEAAK